MSRHPFKALNSSIRTLGAALTAAALATLSACAPKPATPTPTPAAPAAPAISQTCPGPTDGPSIIVQAVEDAHRAMVANPTGPVPPVCLVTAFAHIQTAMPDSLEQHAIAIAAELDKRGTNRKELLASEIALLARAHRYPEVSRAYDRLVAIDPRPSTDVLRIAIVAAYQRADSASLLRLLNTAAARPDAPPALKSEQNVMRQVAALKSAINESRGLIRQNAKYVQAYPSLVGNFGTMGATDSVVAYIARGLRQGTSRGALAPALDLFVNAMLRHAAVYGSSYGWDAQIAAAARVDSALSTSSTKFLVASLIVQGTEPLVGELTAQITGSSLAPRSTGGAEATDAAQQRGMGCQRVTRALSSLDVASAKLHAGGDRYTGGGVAQIAAGIGAERERLSALQDVCTRAP